MGLSSDHDVSNSVLRHSWQARRNQATSGGYMCISDPLSTTCCTYSVPAGDEPACAVTVMIHCSSSTVRCCTLDEVSSGACAASRTKACVCFPLPLAGEGHRFAQ
eukprot:1304753-Amphidinium_carterae.1